MVMEKSQAVFFVLHCKVKKYIYNDFKCVHGRLCHLCCADHSLIM